MCLWDAESLRELELDASDVGQAVRGFVPKHSRYYFEQKIAYTRPMLAGGDPARWDDVAVAHEKLDDHGEALRVGIRLSADYGSDAFDDDETFAAGQAEVAQLAAEEDERLRAGERAALFGY